MLKILVFCEALRHSYGDEGRDRSIAWERTGQLAWSTQYSGRNQGHCLNMPAVTLVHTHIYKIGGNLFIMRVLIISISIFPSRKQWARCEEGSFLAAIEETLEERERDSAELRGKDLEKEVCPEDALRSK